MNFVKENFEYHGGYLHYKLGDERKFVARFKHRGPVSKARFQRMLIKYYSVENYFGRLAGAYNPRGEAPLQILMNDKILNFEDGRFVLDGKAI